MRVQNDVYAEFFKDYSRYYYSIGGRWSAKTYENIQDIIDKMLNFGGKACFMRKVYSSLKDTLYSDTIDYLRTHEIPFTKTVSPLNIKIGDNEIIFKGADDPEKNKGLSKVTYLLLDEANEFSEMDFETLDQSIRGEGYQSIHLCHNPVPKIPGSQYWFEKLFKVDRKRGVVKRYYDERLGSHVSTLKTTYIDNAFCPDHVKRRLEGYKETNPDLYKLWALGEYAELKGVILTGWDIVSSVPEGVDCLGYGLDFGFSSDPAACVQVWGNSTDLWVQGKLYSTGLTNEELFAKLTERQIGTNDLIIADSAEPKSIESLFRSGLRGIRGAKKRANYKAEVANILRGYKIHLIDGDTDLQREFSTWSWDEDKTGKLLPRPKDGNDHYIDALIMLIHEHRGSRVMSGGSL